jgi:lysozyme family protein
VYWSAVKGDALPAGVDLLVFDHGVNAGPKRAIKILQRCVGAYPDGVIGQVTLREVDRADPLKLVQKYSNRRLWYYQSLRLWSRYGRGWGRRVKEARTEAHLLAERAVFEELEWEREAA